MMTTTQERSVLSTSTPTRSITVRPWAGCWENYQTCNVGGGCRACRSDAYAESQLSCRQHHNEYYNYGEGQDNTFIHGGTVVADSLAAHCSWEIRRFYDYNTDSLGDRWVIYEPDGRTIKRGTVRGMCTIADQAEECNTGHKEGGPLCGGMTITIDAYWYDTQDAWWKVDQDVRLGDDKRYGGDPSCCILDSGNAGGIGWWHRPHNSGQCGTKRRSEEMRTGNASATAPGEATIAGKKARMLQQTAPGASTANYVDTSSATTASYYNNDHYSGSYRYGGAHVFWGTFYATSQGTGLFQWVVDTYPAGTGNGVPPNNRYKLEPNSFQLLFNKEVHSYGYAAATKDRQE